MGRCRCDRGSTRVFDGGGAACDWAAGFFSTGNGRPVAGEVREAYRAAEGTAAPA